MTLTLKIWRQKNATAPGQFETYEARDVLTDMSLLEMLDVVNESIIARGEDPIAFDSDCREGICGMCSLVINGIAHGGQRGTATCQLHLRHFKDGETITIEPWRARARNGASSCTNALQEPGLPPDMAALRRAGVTGSLRPIYAWTDLTYLLHKRHVSWRYYVFTGTEPDCADDGMICESVRQGAKTPGIWNPLPYFDTVRQNERDRVAAPQAQLSEPVRCLLDNLAKAPVRERGTIGDRDRDRVG